MILFEGVACYCRHPGDARVNARSGRDVRTSPKVANRAHSEIHCATSPLCAEGPPLRARVWPKDRDLWRAKNSKRSLSVAETWRSKQRSSPWIHEKRKEIHYNLLASCLSKLHSDPTFSIALFFASGPPLWLRSRPPDARDSATLPATPRPAPRRLVLYHTQKWW